MYMDDNFLIRGKKSSEHIYDHIFGMSTLESGIQKYHALNIEIHDKVFAS